MRDKCILPFLITERLEFFQLTQADLPELEILLGDPEIMYAWEHGFTKIESQAWLNENLRRYSSDGYSYWAVRKKNDGSLIGVMGILKEVAEGKQYIGIGYILNKKYWGQGYAGEGTAALCQYAFRKLRLQTLTAQVRTNNFASQHIAEGLGMKAMCNFVKIYRGQEMPHFLYTLDRDKWLKTASNGTVIMLELEAKKDFLQLLLLGDEDEKMLDRYLKRGDLFALYKGDLKATVVVTQEKEDVFEVKNLAVWPQEQRSGYGRFFMTEMCRLYSRLGTRMLVGTGDVFETLNFYQACGFRRSHVIKNFFTDNYPQPIFENGIQLKDMVYLERFLKNDRRLKK